MSIASAIFSDSQSKVYRWIFGQPDRQYHLSELRRLTGLGSASLQRELNRLVETGLVCSERKGNMRYFKAYEKSPVYPELVALTRKTLGIVPILQEALAPISPKLHAAWIYGSVARQTDTAQSDIDVMLVGDDLFLGEVLELLIPVEAQLGRKINPNCYTVDEFERRLREPDSFVSRVLANPVLALVGGAP